MTEVEKKPGVLKMRGVVVGASAAVAIGLAVAGTLSPIAGGVLVVAGWLVFVYALHGFGRAGSERKAHNEDMRR